LNHLLAWHYTTGEKFIPIVESGELRPATAYVPDSEKPILWFSTHQYFEPTAQKSWVDESGSRLLSIPELFKLAGGLIRFGYPKRELLRGGALRRGANMDSAIWAGLKVAAQAQGGNPDDWWGCLGPVPVQSCVVEVMDENLRWVRVKSPTNDERQIP
jgi:hypothetical protein